MLIENTVVISNQRSQVASFKKKNLAFMGFVITSAKL